MHILENFPKRPKTDDLKTNNLGFSNLVIILNVFEYAYERNIKRYTCIRKDITLFDKSILNPFIFEKLKQEIFFLLHKELAILRKKCPPLSSLYYNHKHIMNIQCL